MKKIGLWLLFFLSIVLLAGCQEDQDTFTVEVRDLSGDVVISEEVVYPKDTTLSLLELIDEAVDLDYQTSQWGAFIQGVAGFYPTEYGITYNYYLGLYVNDEMSSTGLDVITYEEDMVISFRESTMLSEFDLAIDAWILSFVDEHLDTYISQEGLSQHVLAALILLNEHGYDVVDLNTLTYPNPGVDSMGNLLKSALISYAQDETMSSLEDALLALTPTNPYDAVTFLNIYDILFGPEVSTKQTEVISYLLANDPTFMDADFAGMALSAVSSHQDDPDVSLYITRMNAEITNNQTSTGVSAWGNANASSTAASIMGLYAVGEDPRAEAYTIEDIDLVEALWSYRGSSGFKYLSGDAQDDLAFSTPQAFAALVMYKIYRDQHVGWTSPELNLWSFSS